MDQQTFVYVDLDGTSHLVGRLWLHNRKRVESATFRYDEEWLRNPARFPLEPALQMDTAPHHTAAGKSLFGALGNVNYLPAALAAWSSDILFGLVGGYLLLRTPT